MVLKVTSLSGEKPDPSPDKGGLGGYTMCGLSGNRERFPATTSRSCIWVDENKPFALKSILKVQRHALEIDHTFGIHVDIKAFMLNDCIALVFWRELQIIR